MYTTPNHSFGTGTPAIAILIGLAVNFVPRLWPVRASTDDLKRQLKAWTFGVAAQRAGLDECAPLHVGIINLDQQASAGEWADQRGSAPEAVAIPRDEKFTNALTSH